MGNGLCDEDPSGRWLPCTDMGHQLWTDGKVGTDDDAGRRELLVHNGALENFLLAGIEAYASMRIENDESLKGNLKKMQRKTSAMP